VWVGGGWEESGVRGYRNEASRASRSGYCLRVNCFKLPQQCRTLAAVSEGRLLIVRRSSGLASPVTRSSRLERGSIGEAAREPRPSRTDR
jgi:hypothetical protein